MQDNGDGTYYVHVGTGNFYDLYAAAQWMDSLDGCGCPDVWTSMQQVLIGVDRLDIPQLGHNMKTPLRMPIQLSGPFDHKELDTSGYIDPTNAEIEGIESVYQTTGFTNFSDYEILKVLLDSSQYNGQRDLRIWILAETRRRDKDDPTSASWYEVQITFLGIEIETLELWDFNHQNVIWCLLVKRQDHGKLGVLLSSSFGCGFKLVCRRAQMQSMEPAKFPSRAVQAITVRQ